MPTPEPTAHHRPPSSVAAGSLVLVGADRAFRTTIATGAAAWVVVSAGLGWSARARLDGARLGRVGPITGDDAQEVAARLAPTPFAVVLVVGAVVLVVLAVLQRFGRPRARLDVVGGTVTFRHRLGTGRRQVAGVDLVTVGDLVERQTLHGDDVVELSVGTCLRLARASDPKRAITVACRTPNDLHRRWEGLTYGPDVRRWDLTLDAEDFAALQQALVAAGALAPTTQPLDRAPHVRQPWRASDLFVFWFFGLALVASLVRAFVL